MPRPTGRRFPALFWLVSAPPCRFGRESRYLEASKEKLGRRTPWLRLLDPERQPTRLAITFAVTAALIAPVSGHDSSGPHAKTHSHRQQHQPPGVRYFRSPDDAVGRERSDADRNLCLDPVRGLGKQWITAKGALDAARKDWMERVRYDHGESFVDISHAAGAGSRCGRVSIAKILGQVTYRCEIVARPCQARFEQGAAVKTASVASPPAAAAPQVAIPPPATTAPPTAAPLAVLQLLKKKLSLRRHQYRAAPAQPADNRQPSMRLAALFMGQIVTGAVGTMESAPASATAFVYRLLNAAFEFPILYRALSIGTSR